MRIHSWQRFTLGLRLILCGGPFVICVFSLAEFPGRTGWWMLAGGGGTILVMIVAPAVVIIESRRAFWFVAFPFWGVRIRLDDIARVHRVRVRPAEDFGGWGIKGSSRRRGLLFAADGEDAVQIVRKDGRIFMATSHIASESARAIEQRCQESTTTG